MDLEGRVVIRKWGARFRDWGLNVRDICGKKLKNYIYERFTKVGKDIID